MGEVANEDTMGEFVVGGEPLYLPVSIFYSSSCTFEDLLHKGISKRKQNKNPLITFDPFPLRQKTVTHNTLSSSRFARNNSRIINAQENLSINNLCQPRLLSLGNVNVINKALGWVILLS